VSRLKCSIWVKTSFTGFHCWPEAQEDIAYLRDLHRHNFGVRVEFDVTHSDREVEFHQLLKQLNEEILPKVKFRLEAEPRMSCEDMALLIASNLPSKNMISVSVDEDNECGAIVRK